MGNKDFDIQTEPTLNDLDSYYSHENLEEGMKKFLNVTSEEIEKTEEKKNPKFIFKKCNKKRGRKAKGKGNRKPHSREANDNIMIKIQTHYFSFIINLLNDNIKSSLEGEKIEFKKFSHSQICDASKKRNLIKIKKLKIYELLLKMEISPKYKKCEKDHNKKNLKNLIVYPWLKDLVMLDYLELFEMYYNKKQPLKELIIGNKRMLQLKEAKSFYYLLQENDEIEENLIKTAEEFYKNDFNSKVEDEVNN